MIIGLSGYAQVGKDTVGAMLVEHHGYTRLSFAQTLKDVLLDVNPRVGMFRPLEDWRNGYDAHLPAAHPGRCETAPASSFDWEYAKKEPEVRRLLQALGVACRNRIGPDVWVDAVMRQYDELQSTPNPDMPGFSQIVPVVITDVRFPNEAEAIIARGGQVWRIERPGHGPVNGHESETALDRWGHFYGWLYNDCDLDALRRMIDKVVLS